MALTGKQRRFLRAKAHHLDAVVLVGASGITDAVVAKVVEELEHHELLKVRIHDGPLSAKESGPVLSERTNAELVQVIGKTVVLYKRRPKEPTLRLPST